MNLSVSRIILEFKLHLNFFHSWLLRASQQQEVNDFSSLEGMSLQSYTANYWPSMHTTAFCVLRVKTDFFVKNAKERLSIFSEAALVSCVASVVFTPSLPLCAVGFSGVTLLLAVGGQQL